MKNEISSHLITSRENLAPKIAEFPVLELIKYHDVMMQLRKPHAHLIIICAWFRKIADFVEMFAVFNPDFRI